ncbi:MAG: hypothetical protein LW695_03200 [Phenylobacterium sp.]|nr:hypothetical protein [Phenylobacterium sp.]
MSKESYFVMFKILFCIFFPVLMGSIAFTIEMGENLGVFIREYQTLISAFLGAIVSVVGIIVVVHQINENSRIEANIRKRKINSAIAGMPEELVTIISWTKDINKNYKSLIEENIENKNGFIEKGFDLLGACDINVDDFKSLRIVMENTDNEFMSSIIMNLFHNIQINKSRYKSIKSHNSYYGGMNTMINKSTLIDHMYLNVRINAIASDLISETRFSLGDNKIIKPSKENILNSMSTLEIYEDEFPEVYRQLIKY